MTGRRRSPEFYLLTEGVMITAEHAYLLHKRTNINDIRVHSRGLDDEFAGVLLALRKLAMSYSPRSDKVPANGSDVSSSSELAGQLSSEDAADLLGISSRAVTKAINSAALPAVKVKGRWVVQSSDLEQYRADRKVRGA